MEELLGLESSLGNLCMKCNKGGDLLICCSENCPIVVHKSCVACRVSIDDDGSFCCPYCMCQKAEAEYRRAREFFLSRMKDLSAFLSGKTVEANESDDGGLQSKDLKRKLNRLPCNDMKDTQRCEFAGIRGVENVKGDEFGTSAASLGQDIPEDVIEETFSSSEDFSHKQLKEQEIIEPQTCSVNVEDVTPKRRSCRRSAAVAMEKISNSKYDAPTSPEQPRLRTPKLDDNVPRSRKSKRLKWGSEEVEILKEGLQKFSQVNRNIPWRKILEYGHDVFNENRTPGDLKEKWKNLSKYEMDIEVKASSP